MTTWNMFSDDVKEERRKVRAYGVDKIMNYPGMSVGSYKQQAKRELAMRLELEEKVKHLEQEANTMVDRLEDLELKLEIVSRCLTTNSRRPRGVNDVNDC